MGRYVPQTSEARGQGLGRESSCSYALHQRLCSPTKMEGRAGVQDSEFNTTTVEPLNKGHFGANSFVPCREVVPISEGPLSEVPLYLLYPIHFTNVFFFLYSGTSEN